MRRILLVLALALVATPVFAQELDPNKIPLPDGWQPEGIAAGPDGTLYVGSIPTGAVLRLDSDTGQTATIVEPAEGRAAIGLKRAGSRLVVAGGPTGKAFVYNRTSGDLIKAVKFGKKDTFVNDVTVSGGRAYFTDSRRSVIYSLKTNGKQPKTIKVPDVPGDADFNLNGIAAAGKYLLAVHSGDGDLYRIAPKTGKAKQVDLGDATLENGDGLLLKGSTLYVVQNRSNLISSFDMAKNFASGEKTGELTNDEFDVPTTVAALGDTLYAVNARFGTEATDSTPYWVTTVRR